MFSFSPSRLHTLALGLVASAAVHAAPAQPQTGLTIGGPSQTDRLIIKYRSGETALPTAQASISLRVAGNRQGVSTTHVRRMANGAHLFQFSRRMTVEEARIVAQNMRAGDPNVEYAEPDLLLQSMQATYSPADPMYTQQWALTNSTSGIRAPAAWTSTRGSGVVVAVIDTGVRPHADLRANLLAGIDFITDTKISNDGNGRDGDAADPGDGVAAGFCATGSPARSSSWHGTHVAGIVAAASNSQGVTGVAPDAKILPVRALGRCGGYTSDIADAVAWASGASVAGIAANSRPARVINLSLGGVGTCSATMQNAIQGARSRGAVVVVSAGNSNVQASQITPANCSGVITVAATGISGGKASYSNFGTPVTLAAPGGDGGAGILSTLNAGQTAPGADNYAAYMGTSMAAPMVSGVAALMIATNPSLTSDQITSLLQSTATSFPAACSGCGSGIVNAGAAVAAARSAAGAATPPPTSTPPPPPTTPAPPVSTATTSEVEPNNTVAQAQVLGAATTLVNGNLSLRDQDHVRVNLGAGKQLVAVVRPASATAAGIGVFLSNGQALLTLPGAAGAARQVTVTNSGTTAVDVVLRVYHSGGAAGAYSLSLAR